MAHFPDWWLGPSNFLSESFKNFVISEESLYSSSKPYHLAQVQKCLTNIKKPTSILDATAHVGCDTLNFHIMYPSAKITSVELDPKIAMMLQHNVGSFATVICNDCINIFNLGKKYSLVYLDPPWGGPDYQKHKLLRLEVSGIPLGKLVVALLKSIAPLVVLKLPINFDQEEFKSHFHTTIKCQIFDIFKNSKKDTAYRLACYSIG